MNVQSPNLFQPVMSERRVSIIGALLVAIGPVSMALFTPAMPELVNAFGTTEAAVKMTLSMYFAGFAIAQLICGPLSDGFGRKPVTAVFIAIYLVASVMALLSPTIEWLVVARFIQGVGAAVGVAISRAIVRDLFTHERSARIMNLIGIILAAGPAFAPFLGGLTMELAGWQAIFYVMIGAGAALMLTIHLAMRETVTRDLSRIRPAQLVRSYGRLLGSAYFLTASLTIAGSLGAIYAQAAILPFIMMNEVGLSATAFGLSMLMQSGMFFVGSLVVRALMPRHGAFRLVAPGLVFIAIASLALAVLLHVQGASFYTVMLPVGLYAFGIAFVMPAMTTAALAPFPHMAGAASSMMGFFQMGAGMVGGAVAAAMPGPVAAMAIVIPTMGLIAVAAGVVFARLPEPVLAKVVAPPVDGTV
jgi:MFS transporter, DHA1 family, multidrug resistance protein